MPAVRIVKICEEGLKIVKICWAPLSPTNFVALSDDGKLTAVDYTTRENREVGMVSENRLVTSFSWSPGGQHLACGCSGGTIVLLDMAGTENRRIPPPDDSFEDFSQGIAINFSHL